MSRTDVTVFAVALFLAAPARAADKFNDLLKDLPPSVNAVIICDVQSIYGSPLATKGKWAASSAAGFPAGIQQVVLGTKIDPHSLRPTATEYGVAYLKVRLTMDDLTVREMGARDTIVNAPAVLSPRNAYFIELRPWTIGMVAPANRQEAAQFVRFVRNSPGVKLSPFLTAALVNVDAKTQFVLAHDLADAIHPEQVRAKIAKSKALAGKQVNIDALTKLLTSLQGLRLEVRIADDIRGELRVMFDQDVTPFAALAGPIFHDVLAERGAAVDEVADWTAEAAGNTVVFRGPLTEKSFRRIATLIQPPPPAVGTGEEPQLAADLKRHASLHFVTMVTTYLADLHKPTRQAKKSYENYALWYETFAQKVGQLPQYNVDEDVLKYGYGVSERLRAIAGSLRGDVVDVNALEKKISFGVSAGAYFGAPSLWVQTNQGQIRQMQQDVIDRSEQTRQEILKTIDAETAAIQAKMAQKYPTNP